MQTKEDILASVKSTLTAEAHALTNAADSLDISISDIIYKVYHIKGRVIVTGIGKSAIVAQKIVATFNSTGTPSLYMHAADAIHGDLGMINTDDIVICISKSGETPEIKVLIPLLRNLGNTIIAMTNNAQSTLALSSDHQIFLPMDVEADPNNLAPTTSTTMQMAMGDAIAIALLKMKGFTPADFAKFHPGGSLGKQLYLRVSGMVDHLRKPQNKPDDSIQEVILQISKHRYGATCVIDHNDVLIGIITDGDLRRMLESKKNWIEFTASDILNTSPKTCQVDDMAVNALDLLKNSKIQQLIVLEADKYVGILHMHDFLKEGLH